LDRPSQQTAGAADEAFARWLERELEQLELQFHGFVTPCSLVRSLKVGRK
jgi:hypothetical protein